MASKSRLAKVTLPTDAEPGTELVTWSCKEGYVYVPIPPAGSAGHRADKWDVDKWFKALKVELVSFGDNMTVRLSDQESGELFADCPLPADGTPLTTAVEPVVDSSRYFVLRVVDQETGKHAFIGLGFRERSDASGFTTGLDEYRKYVKRKQEADAMKADYERQQQQENGEGAPQRRDYSLKSSITIPLKIGSSATKKQESDEQAHAASQPSGGEAKVAAAAATTQSLVQAVGGLKLVPPPPPPATSRLAAAPGAEFESEGSGVVAVAAGAGAPAPLLPSGGAGGAGAVADDGDEWSDFTGTSS